jgi:hypothetical protein
VVGGLAFLHWVVCLLAFNPAPHTGGDNATYISLARSLLERGDFTEIWDPALRPYTLYPPVFPAFLAAAMALGLTTWAQLKLVVVVTSAVAVGVTCLWLRRVASPGVALTSGVLLALAPGVVNASHWVLSDPLFWLLCMLVLLAHARLGDGGRAVPASVKHGPTVTGWMLLLAVSTALAYLTRSAALPLVMALFGVLAWRRRWLELALVGTVFVPAASLWALRNARSGGSGYLDYFWLVDPYQPHLGTLGLPGIAERIAGNARSYIEVATSELFFGAHSWAGISGAALLLAAAAGWAKRCQRRPDLPELLLPLYLATLLAWPSVWASARFLLPVAPLLLLYAVEAVRDLSARLAWPYAMRLPLALIAGALVVPNLFAEVRIGSHCRAQHADGSTFACLEPEWRDLFTVASQLNGRLPDETVVLSRKPTLFYMLSGYRGRMYPMSAEPDSFFRVMDEVGASYVVVDQIPGVGPLYLHPVLLARRDDFCIVAENSLPGAALARIEPGGAPRAENAPANAFRPCQRAREQSGW